MWVESGKKPIGRAGTIPSPLASANDAQDVGFLHDQQVFAVDLDLGARPLAEQHLVAGLDVERRHLAVLALGARAGGDDLAFLRLFLGGVGDDDPARGLLVSLDAADEDAVVQRTKSHVRLPFCSRYETLLALTRGECQRRAYVKARANRQRPVR